MTLETFDIYHILFYVYNSSISNLTKYGLLYRSITYQAYASFSILSEDIEGPDWCADSFSFSFVLTWSPADIKGFTYRPKLSYLLGIASAKPKFIKKYHSRIFS